MYTAEVFGGRVQKFRPKPDADPAKVMGQELRYTPPAAGNAESCTGCRAPVLTPPLHGHNVRDQQASMRLTHPLWRARPMVIAIVATICAAALVLFFQYRAISTLQSQTEVIVRQISEQTAADIAAELRRTLAGPVLDTLDGGEPAGSARGTARSGGAGIRAGAAGVSARRSLLCVEHRDRRRRRRAKCCFSAATAASSAIRRSAAPSSSWRDGMHRPSTFTSRRKTSARASGIRSCCACSGTMRSASTTSLSSASSSIRRPCRRDLFEEPRRARINALLARRGGDVPLQPARHRR